MTTFNSHMSNLLLFNDIPTNIVGLDGSVDIQHRHQHMYPLLILKLSLLLWYQRLRLLVTPYSLVQHSAKEKSDSTTICYLGEWPETLLRMITCTSKDACNLAEYTGVWSACHYWNRIEQNFVYHQWCLWNLKCVSNRTQSFLVENISVCLQRYINTTCMVVYLKLPIVLLFVHVSV